MIFKEKIKKIGIGFGLASLLGINALVVYGVYKYNSFKMEVQLGDHDFDGNGVLDSIMEDNNGTKYILFGFGEKYGDKEYMSVSMIRKRYPNLKNIDYEDIESKILTKENQNKTKTK